MHKVKTLCLLWFVALFSISNVKAAPQPGLWNIDEELTGNPGRGFQIDSQGDVLILTFYGYEETGEPTFYLSSGPFTENSFEAELLQFEGGKSFGGDFQDAALIGPVGLVKLEFDSTTTGTIELPGEQPKTISRFSFNDLSGELNGQFEGLAYGVGPFADDSSTFTFDLADGNFSLIRNSFFSGECRFEGVYELAGAGINAIGTYRCSDFSEGDFVAEQLSVNPLGIYTGLFERFPENSEGVIREIHTGR